MSAVLPFCYSKYTWFDYLKIQCITKYNDCLIAADLKFRPQHLPAFDATQKFFSLQTTVSFTF